MKNKVAKTKSTAKKAARRTPKKEIPLQEKSEDFIKIGLYNLRPPKGAHKRNKLKGRGSGSGHGKTSTRGSKGQTSRAGRATYPGFEGGQMPLIRKIPKRGFTSQSRKVYQIVNIKSLTKIKEETITPELLETKGLIKDRNKLVKILGDGEIKAPLVISAHAFSNKAEEKIKAAGGRLEIINA
jgi:large subunit ribosomal protein L15